MRRHGNFFSHAVHGGCPNMTPLVDVVMVLLIFLMLVGSFGGGEQFLATRLPVTRMGRADSAFATPLIEVRIDATSGRSAWTARVGDLVTGSPHQLSLNLRDKLEALASAGRPPDQVQVVINPGHQVRWQSLVVVYQAAIEAGGCNVAFSTSH